MTVEYSFWLLPAEPLKSRLRAVIRDLATEFDAPVFEPHVTFYHGPSSDEEACALLEETAGNFAPLELDAEGLRQSDLYAKTFFIQFQKSPMAQQIADTALGAVADPAPYALDPHLSLLYKNLAEEQRQQLRRRPLAPMGKYRFDAVCASTFESPWSDKAAKGYRIIAEYGLREGFRRRADDLK